MIKSGLYYEIIEHEGKKLTKIKTKMYISQLGVWISVVIIVKNKIYF